MKGSDPTPARARSLEHGATEPPGPEALLREAGWVHRLARCLARDQAAADDVAQGALALALEKRPVGALRPWLARTAWRLARGQRRSEARRRARELRARARLEGASLASDQLLERLEQQQELAQEVRRLPEPYRGVVLQHYYEGLSAAEIGRRSGVPAGTVRSQLARGLERLRRQCASRRESHALLPFFLLAAGSTPSLLPRLTAPLLAMKTSLQVAAGTILVAALAGSAALSGLFVSQDTGELAAAPAAPAVSQALAPLAQPTEPSALTVERAQPVLLEDPAAGEAAPLAAAEEPRTTVIARLVDSSGRTLPGARLASIYSDGRPRGQGNVAEADAAGRVRLELADEAVRHWQQQVFPMVFAAREVGHATSFRVSTPNWHGETDMGDITLEPGGGLSGLVTDAWGQPVAGAVLYAAEPILTAELEPLRIAGPDTTIVRPRADSGADGRFVLDGIVGGEWRLWAHAPHHKWTITEPEPVTIGGLRDCGTIVLEEVPPEARITGLVLRPDATPAAGAEVAFESQATREEGTLRTDEQGRFRMVPKGPGPVHLIARDPSLRLGPSKAAVSQAGQELTLELSEARTIEALVVDPNGTPIANASMMPFLPEGGMFADGLRPYPGQDWIRSDDEGRAQIPVPNERFLVTASLRGYKGERFGPFEPQAAPAALTIELVPEPKIEGRVLAYGEPAPGMKILIAQRIEDFVPREAGFPVRFFINQYDNVLTDEEGRFSCSVDEEWTDITVLAHGGGWATGETELTVEAGVGACGVEVQVTRGGVLTGVVLPPAGESAHGLVVAASRGDGKPIWTRVEEDGGYRLEGLTPGPWRVEGRDREPAREVLSVANRPEDKEFNWNVELVDGQETEFTVDMRGQGAVALHGSFLVDGAPAAGWTVELVAPRDRMQREAMPAVAIADDGSFVLEARAGRFDLRLVGPLPGGARVEVLRELNLEGPRTDWGGQLATMELDEAIEEEVEEVRLVRGRYNRGEREITHAPVVAGRCRARVPRGRTSLQVSRGEGDFGTMWHSLRMLEEE